MPHAIAYFTTLVVFLAFDAVWLSLMGERLYRSTLKDIMLEKFRVAPAAVFYAVFVVGIMVFAIVPALHAASWRVAAVYGALFGFFSFGVYDFTNLATLRNWQLKLCVFDLAWGTFITGLAATAGYVAAASVQ